MLGTSLIVLVLFALVGQAAWAETKRLDDTISILIVFAVLLLVFFYGAFHS
jgi:hypothetical protein